MATKKTSASTAKTGAKVKKAPAKKTAVKKAAVKKVAAKKTVKKAPAKKVTKTAAKKTVAKKATGEVVRLVVSYDAGFGNQLFIRGNAQGLSWDKGVALENTASDQWEWKAPASTKACEVKVLLNDSCWDVGENLVIKGTKVVHTPVFG